MKKDGRITKVRAPRRDHTTTTTSVALSILTVIVLLIGGLGVAMERSAYLDKSPERTVRPEEVVTVIQRDLDSELFFLATDAISQVAGPNLAQSNIIFKASVKDMFEQHYDPRHYEDYRITITSYKLGISIMPMSVVASVCSSNISRAGDVSAFTTPAYYRIEGNILFDIKDSDRTVSSVNMSVDRLIPDITPFVATRLSELDANGKSEFTDIGRMVRYMLTTLVRFRASQGIGSGPYDTEKDLLNEGDVELAMNMAILLEEARLFGAYDPDAVSAVDHYFYYATDPEVHSGEASWEPYNPTGIRPWGSAERKNYARFQNHMPSGGGSTLGILFSSLVNSYVYDRTIDPADLLAVYLNLRQYESGLDIFTLDDRSILQDKFLFDGRYMPDRRDSSMLVYQTQTGPQDLLLRDPTGAFELDYKERFSVDQSPNYLVVGSDLSVTKNITVPWKWMSNARLSESSRTGGVPPPQPPPDHDWVMLWEFDIKGDFNLAVGRAKDGSQEDGSARRWLVNRSIELDIPISIFTFLKIRPMNSAVTFTNLNTGSPPGATYNFTFESLAYEHFSNSTWGYVKDIYTPLLSDAIRLVKSSTCPYHSALGQGSDIAALQAAQDLRQLPQDVWDSVDDFVATRILEPPLSTQILRPFLNSEYFFDIDYIKGDGTGGIDYTLRMAIRTNVGVLTIDLLMSRGPTGPTGRVVLDSHLKVGTLIDVDNDLVWDATKTNLRPQGTGRLGGDWSLITMVQGKTTVKALDVELSPTLYVRFIHERPSNAPDMTSTMASAVPKELSYDPAVALTQITEAINGLGLSGLTVLIATYEYELRGWHFAGLTTSDSTQVGNILKWVSAHANTIMKFNEYGRLDGSAIGTSAAEDLNQYQSISAVVIKQRSIERIPLLYYLDASQMFTLEREYGPLSCTMLDGMDTTYQDGPTGGTYFATMEYTQFSQVLLTEPEAGYD